MGLLAAAAILFTGEISLPLWRLFWLLVVCDLLHRFLLPPLLLLLFLLLLLLLLLFLSLVRCVCVRRTVFCTINGEGVVDCVSAKGTSACTPHC